MKQLTQSVWRRRGARTAALLLMGAAVGALFATMRLQSATKAQQLACLKGAAATSATQSQLAANQKVNTVTTALSSQQQSADPPKFNTSTVSGAQQSQQQEPQPQQPQQSKQQQQQQYNASPGPAALPAQSPPRPIKPKAKAKPKPRYYSQNGQDQYLAEVLFRGVYNGTFLEAGAFDGVNGSNTAFLERSRGWVGACVEPNPGLHRRVVAHRTCTALNALICDSEQVFNFTQFTPPRESYSGILQFFPQWKVDKLMGEIERNLTRIVSTTELPCLSLRAILDALGQRHLDLLSLDVEGSEYEVIQQIDGEAIQVDVVLVEGSAEKVDAHLKGLGFYWLHNIGEDNFWVRNGSLVHKRLWQEPAYSSNLRRRLRR